MFLCSKVWRKVLMGVLMMFHKVILLDKSQGKPFSNNSLNYGSFYIEDNIKSYYFICLVLGKLTDEKRNIHRDIHTNNGVFAGFNHLKFCLSGDPCFQFFCSGKGTKNNLMEILRINFLKNLSLLSFTWTLVLDFFSQTLYLILHIERFLQHFFANR